MTMPSRKCQTRSTDGSKASGNSRPVRHLIVETGQGTFAVTRGITSMRALSEAGMPTYTVEELEILRDATGGETIDPDMVAAQLLVKELMPGALIVEATELYSNEAGGRTATNEKPAAPMGPSRPIEQLTLGIAVAQRDRT